MRFSPKCIPYLPFNFFKKNKFIVVPTNAGWTVDKTGTGAVTQRPFYLYLVTGTTPSSRALCNQYTFGLMLPNSTGWDYFDFSKRFEWEFVVGRGGSDPEAVARIQIKLVATEGALANLGLGLEINNLDVNGEAYGLARGTVALGTFVSGQYWRIRIVLVPAARVEFWVNGVLKGTLTGTAVPTGVTASVADVVVSIINGVTGGVNATLACGNLRFIQEW